MQRLGGLLETHGGYLCRYEDVDVAWLQRVAHDALLEDGQMPAQVGLQITVLGGPQLVRFAFDAAFTYGRKGAHWYCENHALARRLSEHLSLPIHAYGYDPDDFEQVLAFGNGRRVGGETLRYDDAELDDDVEDEAAFDRAADKWPLGHLARVLGVSRAELIRIPRRPTVLIELSKPAAPGPLWKLFPDAVRLKRRPELYAS